MNFGSCRIRLALPEACHDRVRKDPNAGQNLPPSVRPSVEHTALYPAK